MKNVSVKTKKMLLVLPVIAIPFLTMAFWALGGGKGKKEVAVEKGLNLALPDANLKDDKAIDKLGFYDQAAKDSLKREEWQRNDPYYTMDTVPSYPTELEGLTDFSSDKYKQRLNTSLYDKPVNSPDEQIIKKLKVLQEQLNNPVPVSEVTNRSDEQFSGELDRLEGMLKVNNGAGEDPELKQLQGTLDRILDIQHPDRVKERSLKVKGAVYAVRRDERPDTLVKGFFSYSDESEMCGEEQNAVEAVIATNQTIVNGAVVKFRLVNDIYVAGKLIPKDVIVSGVAALEGERLIVEINSIRNKKSLFNVKLEVYDMDGLPGIYIPGTINREVAKESLNNGLSLADMTSVDPSLKAQATATGVGALKSLISKKAKLVRVQVKAGYKVLLKNKNQDQ